MRKSILGMGSAAVVTAVVAAVLASGGANAASSSRSNQAVKPTLKAAAQPRASTSGDPSQTVDGLRALATAPPAQSADAKVVTEMLADPRFGARQVRPSEFGVPRVIAANADTRVVIAISSKATCYGVFSTEGWSNSGCGPTEGLGDNAGAGVVKANDGYLAYAILPDDVSNATVVSSDGSKHGLSRRYNAAIVHVASPPDHLEVQSASGSKSVPFGKLR